MDRKNKIQPIHIDDKMLEDPKMDKFLKKTIMDEADKIEKELNTDPSLQGVGASDDMFEMIKARLKEQGVWEEDKEDIKQNNADAKENSANEKKENTYRRDPEINIKNQDTENPKEDENGKGKKKAKNEQISERIKSNQIESGQIAAGEEEKETEKKIENKISNEDVYSFLSKEDQDALALGKKIKKNRKKRWKKLAAAVAAVAVIFGVGIPGEASKRWILDTWNKITAMTGFSVRTDYVDEDTKRIKDISALSVEEQSAWLEIKKELTVPIVWFSYLPEGMEFKDYDISKELNEACLFYSYEDKLFTVRILTGKVKATTYLHADVEPLLRDNITNTQDIEVEIWDTTTKEIESYMADFEYEDSTFILSGVFPFEEFEELIKNFYII